MDKKEEKIKQSHTKTELEKKNILRLSAQESNRITKECIESALILLMKEKSYEEISITDIVNKSGVSRISYYRNYDSKDAILDKYLDNLIADANRELAKFDAFTEGRKSWKQLLTFTKEHSEEFELLLKADFGDKILRRFIIAMEHNNPDNDDAMHVTNWYLSGLMMTVITQWILDGMKINEDLIADRCYDLMFHGLSGLRKCIL